MDLYETAEDSNLTVENCTYTWTINNYCDLCETGEKFRSLPFKAIGDDFEWCMEHKISTWGNQEYVSFILLPASGDDFKKYSPVSGNLKISVSNQRGRYHSKTEKEGSFQLTFNGSIRGFRLYFCSLLECKRNLVNDDKLRLVCHLRYLKTNNISSRDSTLSDSNPFKTMQCSLSRDLEKIRINANLSDVTLSVKGKDYPSHKIILAARSSVFDAMFANDMLENHKNHIVITDIEQETFEEMLHYIYTGKVVDLEESAFELLPAADKYNLKELKNACEGLLVTKITSENAGKILVLADMHNAEVLKVRVLRFIKENPVNFETEIWNALTKSRPGLMKDMLDMFLKK